MTSLIIGGTGLNGKQLAKLMQAAGHPVLLTSRSGNVPEPFQGVAFNWFESSTFKNPFKADSAISQIFIKGPLVEESLPIAKPFIDLAISKGVLKKFVLLSGASFELDKPKFHAQLHQYLIDTGVDYTVLRPSYFMENFDRFTGRFFKENNAIYSVAEDGKVPYVNTSDIARAAFEALTTDKYSRQDPYVVGPELLTLDEVAAIFTKALGREITHKRLTLEEHAKIYSSLGWPEAHVARRGAWEKATAAGDAEKVFYVPPEKKFVGKVTLEEYVKDNVATWQ